MKDFGRWFADFRPPEQPSAAEPEPMLPVGVWDGVDKSGRTVYYARCRSCERDYELFGSPDEFTQEYSYCGGSPRCLP